MVRVQLCLLALACGFAGAKADEVCCYTWTNHCDEIPPAATCDKIGGVEPCGDGCGGWKVASADRQAWCLMENRLGGDCNSAYADHLERVANRAVLRNPPLNVLAASKGGESGANLAAFLAAGLSSVAVTCAWYSRRAQPTDSGYLLM